MSYAHYDPTNPCLLEDLWIQPPIIRVWWISCTDIPEIHRKVLFTICIKTLRFEQLKTYTTCAKSMFFQLFSRP